MAETRRYLALALALVAITAVILVIEKPWRPDISAAPPPPANLSAEELSFPAAPTFAAATGWIHSEPLDLAKLRGHVVLVDFWTYSCINCIHTFPHVEAEYERYRDDGFLVVGVHTPEFGFERDVGNIESATARYHLTYPVAVDSDYGVWNAYGNHYWPAEYLIDQYGRIRHTHFGEGGYAETERAIRQLLTEAGHPPSAPAGETEDAAAGPAITGELYASDAEGRPAIANDEGYHPGETVTYAPVTSFDPGVIYLGGTWREAHENVTAVGEGASALVHFLAGAGNVVLDGPRGACVQVLLDGAPIPQERAGRDVSVGPDGACMTLDGPRSYDFYAGALEEHTVRLRMPEGAVLFTFDFSRA